MAGGTAEIHEAAFGQQDDALAIRENDVVDLRLDVLPLVFLEVGDIDFVVEVTDVADDGLVSHAVHLRAGDNVVVARRRDDDVDLVTNVVEVDDAVAFHRRLQCADRIDLGNPDGRAEASSDCAQPLPTSP